MRKRKTVAVNFFAGPGSGKSTSAARVFADLKNRDCNVELVTEYAKRQVYEGSSHKLKNQLYITAKQYKLMKDVSDYGVRLILTDSPLILGLIYGKNSSYWKAFEAMILAINSEFENINVLVRRVKKYNPSGRLQTEAQSDAITAELRKMISFDYEINGEPSNQAMLAETLYKKYKRRIAV